MSAVQVTRGAVYDRGYRPYEGKRGRRGAATIALYNASVRRALGLRRSWRQKVAPFVLLAVVTIPAIVNVGIAYVGLIDSRFEARHGVSGVVASDAILNLAGVIVLGFVFWRLGSFGKSRHKP